MYTELKTSDDLQTEKLLRFINIVVLLKSRFSH